MKKPVKLSLVTTCKGRLSYLKESILSWLNLIYENYEIIIVDYDCPDGTEHFIETNRRNLLTDSICTDLRVIKVNNRPYFNLNDARNIGADAAQGKLVFMIDSDVHIRDKLLLQKIERKYKSGVVFFCNPAILTTNFSEGLEFYKYKYDVEIPFPAFLPCHCMESGLTGTVCFNKELYQACGKYDPEINKFGWGSDDIEFYLRYLNYYFYHCYTKRNVILSKHSINYIIRSLDGALKEGVQPFEPDTFRLVENTEEEKEKNYPNPKQISNRMNKEHIRLFFKTKSADVRGDFNRKIDLTQQACSIIYMKRFKKFPLPRWFEYWCNHWLGVARYNSGHFEQGKMSFKNVLRIQDVPLYYQWHSLFYLALIHKQQHKRRWSTYFRKGMDLCNRDSRVNVIGRYNVASFLISFEEYDEAENRFLQLCNDESIDQNLRAGAFFHRGRLALQNKDSSMAMTLFTQALALNPHHKKAFECLEQIRQGN